MEGDFWRGGRPRSPSGTVTDYTKRMTQDIFNDVQRRHADYGTEEWPPQGDAECFGVICGTDSGTYARMGPSIPRVKNNGVALKKGDLVRGEPDSVSLPEVGAEPAPISTMCQEVGAFVERPQETMLLPENEIDWDRYYKIRPYACPGLHDRSALLLLTLRLYLAGMLGYTDHAAETLAFFTVCKKLLPCGRWMTRLVIDYRRGNVLFRRPPWLAMGSPSAFGWLELDTEPEGDVSFFSAVGDVPDYYYRLRLPDCLLPWFVIPDVTIEELRAFALTKGVTIREAVGNQKFLALRVPAMGWSWACWIAHTALQSLLGTLQWFSPAQMVVEGFPAPLISLDKPIHWEYIDDYGVGVLEVRRRNIAEQWVYRIQVAVAKLLRSVGLDVHKVDVAEGLPLSLGVEIRPGSWLCRLPGDRMRRLVLATAYALFRGRLTGRQLSRLLGHWIWAMLLSRSALSVFHGCFAFVRRYWEAQHAQPLWGSVRHELEVAIGIFVFLEAHLATPWLEKAFCTDASEEGFGIVQRSVSVSRLRREGRYCQRRGWMVDAEEAYARLEEDCLGGRVLDGAAPTTAPTPSDIFAVVLVLGTISSEIVSHFASQNWVVEHCLIDFDGMGRVAAPLLVRRTLRLLREKRFSFVLLGVGDGTWCPLRRPALRTGREVRGVSGIAGRPAAAIRRDNFLGFLGLRMMNVCLEVHVLFFCVEASNSLIWGDPSYRDFRRRRVGRRVEEAMWLEQRVWTTASGVKELCRSIVGMQDFGQGLLSLLQGGTLVDGPPRALGRGVVLGRKLKVPPVDAEFMDARAWTLLFKGRWKLREHINVLEARTAVLLLRHLARSRGSWHRRVLILLDSLVSIGMLAKGRSPVYPLLRLARGAAAVQLVLGVRIYLRHVRSALNTGDGPSRGEKVGAAVMTREEHWAELDALEELLRLPPAEPLRERSGSCSSSGSS